MFSTVAPYQSFLNPRTTDKPDPMLLRVSHATWVALGAAVAFSDCVINSRQPLNL
jgi:hypothetical protein